MKKEKKKKKKRNNHRDHDRDDDISSNQERLLVKDADLTILTMQTQSLSLLRSIDENVKFLESVIPNSGSNTVIHSSGITANLDKTLSLALNSLSPYISLDSPYEDDLAENGNYYYYYYYPNFSSYLAPVSNNNYTKYDNLQDSTGRREEVKNTRTRMQPLAQMKNNIGSTYVSRTYFPQAVSQLIPHQYPSTSAFEKKISPPSMTRNVSVKLHADVQANKIASSFKADAVTAGKDIFFAKDKYNTSTPKGIALILHELEHVRQQQTNQDLTKANSGSTTSGNIPASLSYSLEKEALETEKKVLLYLTLYEDYIHRYQVPSSIMMSPTTNMGINSEMPTNYLYPISRTGYSQSHLLNDVFHSSMLNLISDSKFGQGNSIDSPYEMLIQNERSNLKTGGLHLESIGVFPDLVPSSSPTTATHSPAFTGHQNMNADVSVQGHNLIHKTSAMTPFLADSGRSLPGPAPVHQSQPSPTSSSGSTNANTNVQPILTSGSPNHTDFTTDLDQLSDRVYQMIMEKIKIQREQRGFR